MGEKSTKNAKIAVVAVVAVVAVLAIVALTSTSAVSETPDFDQIIRNQDCGELRETIRSPAFDRAEAYQKNKISGMIAVCALVGM